MSGKSQEILENPWVKYCNLLLKATYYCKDCEMTGLVKIKGINNLYQAFDRDDT